MSDLGTKMGDELIAAHDRIAELEAECDEAHRTAGKALEDVRLEREVHVRATEILKEKVRKAETERDEALATAADFESKMHSAAEQLDEALRAVKLAQDYINGILGLPSPDFLATAAAVRKEQHHG